MLRGVGADKGLGLLHPRREGVSRWSPVPSYCSSVRSRL